MRRSSANSIWTSKLKITGKATAEKQVTSLEVSPVLISSGKYTNFSGNHGIFSDYLTWNGDTIDSSDSLSSRLTDTGYATWLISSTNIRVTFTLKNTSSTGVTYTGGTTELDTLVDRGGAISGYSCRTQRATLNSGQSTTVTLNLSLNRNRLQTGTYIKYAIVYYHRDANGTDVPYYYYYTLYISK